MADRDLHLTEHLAELRKRLLITMGAFLVALFAAFFYVEDIYKWLTRDLGYKLQTLGPSDALWVYLMIACVFAIAVTIPIAGFQLWRFVSPGLKDNERRAALAYIPALAILFAVGISFGYFIIYPMVLDFLTSIAADTFETNYTAEKYFRFMINMTVPFGVLFEMPVVVMFLTSLGILNPIRLAKVRKMAYFILTIVAVTITPPDITSDVLVTVPLLLLYEISIGLSRFVFVRKQAKRNLEA
ncbi:twin-arginine translocase subunit TatC [Paenibacillus thermotolerans]|uniref:twin-arginine translocase subunit TatC n=1 Tax=Paenibacillus thermotolerans TaxID=3027807 RepID=UPI0023684637|nr:MULTISPECIES: twin-arginine translocase subunit TatC [unclassified Paenibacillus]